MHDGLKRKMDSRVKVYQTHSYEIRHRDVKRLKMEVRRKEDSKRRMRMLLLLRMMTMVMAMTMPMMMELLLIVLLG